LPHRITSIRFLAWPDGLTDDCSLQVLPMAMTRQIIEPL
jgi:hypothetical protein